MNNIINKIFKTNKKVYTVEMLIDADKIFESITKMGEIIELPENKIRGLLNLKLEDKKEKVTVEFDNIRSRDTFADGCKKYINYRIIGIDYPY